MNELIASQLHRAKTIELWSLISSVSSNFHFYNNPELYVFYMPSDFFWHMLWYDRPPQCATWPPAARTHPISLPQTWNGLTHTHTLEVRQVQAVSCCTGRLSFPSCPSVLSLPLLHRPLPTPCEEVWVKPVLESGIYSANLWPWKESVFWIQTLSREGSHPPSFSTL